MNKTIEYTFQADGTVQKGRMPKPKRIYRAPKHVCGARVRVSGNAPLLFKGELWKTLVPVDPADDSLWEFSLTSGRILRVR